MTFPHAERAGRSVRPHDCLDQHEIGRIFARGRLVDDSRAPNWWTLASPENHKVDIAAWPDSEDNQD